MTNLSIQNFIPFLIPYLFPLKIEEYQRKEGISKKTLWGLPGTDPSMSSACLLFVEKLYPPRPSPIPKSRFNQRSEKMQKQRETVKQDKIIIV